jgi:hypothetical protein
VAAAYPGQRQGQGPITEGEHCRGHRHIGGQYYPMRGFGGFESACRFCSAYDEQRDYFRYRSKTKETVPLSEQCRVFRQRFGALQNMLMAA